MQFVVDLDRDGKLDSLIVEAPTFDVAEDIALEHLATTGDAADIVSIATA